MANVRSILNRALKMTGCYGVGMTPSADDIEAALDQLNSMLASWYLQRYLLPNLTRLEFTTAAGQRIYIFGSDDGSGYTLASSTRPLQIQSGFLTISTDLDQNIEIVAQEEYNRISNKNTAGYPEKLTYNPGESTGYAWMSPVPDAAYNITVMCLVAHTDYTSLDATFRFPNYYTDAVIYNLAVNLAPMFGKKIHPVTAGRADSLLRDLKRVNQNPPPIAELDQAFRDFSLLRQRF